jgi:hypothetical protein
MQLPHLPRHLLVPRRSASAPPPLAVVRHLSLPAPARPPKATPAALSQGSPLAAPAPTAALRAPAWSPPDSLRGVQNPRYINHRIMNPTSLSQLLEVLQSAPDFSAFDHVNIATAVSRLGKLLKVSDADPNKDPRVTREFSRLFVAAEAYMSKFGAREVSNVCHGVVTGGCFELPSLSPAASRLFGVLGGRIKSQVGPTLASTPARGTGAHDVWRLQAFLQQCEPQALSNIAWAFAKAGIRDQAVFALLAKEACSRDLRWVAARGRGGGLTRTRQAPSRSKG